MVVKIDHIFHAIKILGYNLIVDHIIYENLRNIQYATFTQKEPQLQDHMPERGSITRSHARKRLNYKITCQKEAQLQDHMLWRSASTRTKNLVLHNFNRYNLFNINFIYLLNSIINKKTNKIFQCRLYLAGKRLLTINLLVFDKKN